MDSEKLAEEMGVCGFAKKDSLHRPIFVVYASTVAEPLTGYAFCSVCFRPLFGKSRRCDR